MRLTVLGTDGGFTGAGGVNSGYLVREGDFTLWVDAGTGTLARLLERVDLLDVDAVFVSHEHPDHFVDLVPFHVARQFHPERPPELPVYSTPGALGRLVALEPSIRDAGLFALRPVEPGATLEVGPFRLTTRAMAHSVPALGVRIEADGASLAYSGDTGPTDELVAIAKDADALVVEATWLDRLDGLPPLHMTGADAGQHAARADVDRLVVSHFWPTLDRGEITRRASQAFGDDAIRAESGLEVEL